MTLLTLLPLILAASAHPTLNNLGEPHNRQFYYYNQPPTGHVFRRNYVYPPYNEIPYASTLNNIQYRYGYDSGYDPAYFNNQYGFAQPFLGLRQPMYYGGYSDPYAPSELRQNQQELVKNDEIDLSGFKLHHQHHPNKDRVGLKPGHDSGVHGVTFGNDGYGH